MNTKSISQNLAKIEKEIVNSNTVKPVEKICQSTLERVPYNGDTIDGISKVPKGLKAKIINLAQKTEIYKFIQKINKERNTVLPKEQVEKMVEDFKEYKTNNGETLYYTCKKDLANIIKPPSDNLFQEMSEYFYHGTSENAARAIITGGFDSRHQSKMMGSLTRDLGRGIYLSPSEKLAKDYGAKVLTVKFDKEKIGYLNSNDWSRYYNKLSSTISDYGREKKLTTVESNALQNELFGHFLLNGLEVGEEKTKIGGLCMDGMIDLLDILNFRKFLNIPRKNQAQIAIYDPTIIKDIK